MSPTLSATAAAMSPEAFYATYGDRYAAQIVKGAEVFCAIRIPTTSPQDKSTLAATLGFSYGSSNASSAFATAVTSAMSGRAAASVSCGYLGFAPSTLITSLSGVLSAASAFQSGMASTLGTVTPAPIDLVYTTYYGLPGYPGVPAGIATLVAQEAPLGPEFLLYDSLVTNDFSAYYQDANDSGLAFFEDMKGYHDALQTFLSASITNSLSPAAPVPTPAADGVITDWMPTSTLASTGTAAPQYTVYGIPNGVLPKHVVDYAIPLKYAYPTATGGGVLEGVTFPPVTPVQPAASTTSKAPLTYPLYVVKKPGAGAPTLEYQWDAATYLIANATNAAGAPSAAAVSSAITAFGLTGNLTGEYVVVNKATGLVMTDNGTSTGITATHLANGDKSQLWEFYVDAGGDIVNCASYVPPPAADTPGVGCAVSNNGVTSAPNNPPCGSLIYGISAADIASMTQGYWSVASPGAAGTAIDAVGGGGCDRCNWNCSSVHCEYSACSGGPEPNNDFFLQPYDNGSTQAIYNFAASLGNVVSYAVTSTTQSAATLTNQPLVVATAISGYPHELWVFIPSTNVDTAP